MASGTREAAAGTVLVCGALGTVGRAMVEHFDALPGWRVVGLSRRAPDFPTGAEFRSVDLQDRAACEAGLSDLHDITRIVYAAVYEKADVASGWRDSDHAETNLAMLRNAVEAVEASSPGLRHVTLLQGTKAYGAHHGPFKTPAKEREPRYWGPNFYHDQEDWLRDRAARAGWTWTVLRPQVVFGFAVGSNMNALACVAAYAALSKELGMPLRFPGGEPRIQEATDAGLLARAAAWAGGTPAAGGEAFNIANGDCYIWHNLWPRVAEVFDMEPGQPFPCSLRRVMADKGPVWESMVARHGLRPHRLEEIVPSWQFADFIFGYGQRPNPAIVSTIKARQFGFQDCMDTEDMLVELLRQFRRERIVP